MSIRGKCNSCCVPGCNSNSTPSFRNRGGRISTFKLPRDEKRRKEWIQAIPKRKYPPTVNHNVCILHFNEEDFSRNNRRIDLKKSAVPSIFPFVNGQRTDDNTEICDEVWTEYIGHKKDSLTKPLDEIDIHLPAPISDISRILIERLRIPGSKYFGIDTAEITIEPDSDFDSDVCEPPLRTRNPKPSTRKNRKVTKCERAENASSDELGEIDMIHSQTNVDDSVPANQCSNELANDNEDKFGAMVSSKLLLMSPLQRLMSQKIISEILLKGQLDMLKNSLSPVLVTGYVKNNSNTVTSTTNSVAPTDCLASKCDDSSDSDNSDSDDCDPLMFPVKQEKNLDTKFLESFDSVKNEMVWSDDDPA